MSKLLTLYSTQGCHLCEMALELVAQIGLSDATQVVDIAFDDTLFERYGVTIPVLKVEQAELNWPFDLTSLTQWLSDNGITYHT
ncbi:glutaredoxin family protein [Vibrio hippocampi]|uniref:Glutaredoxin family protein n=1 Tax=Vibrio hippocampi TaxID=654686 RepID=A0ABM8ZIF3_9VIBR|nr:glutaredoxin family protein [Vibrio hippocampi]CAH0525999.1 hypothetical protein VHP8226_01481 [Vibrio hippocampi]